MGRLLDRMFGGRDSPSRGSHDMTYEEALAEQHRRRSATSKSLLDVIGNNARLPMDMTDPEARTIQDIQGSPGTGMYQDASPQMVTQLDQITGMLGSDNSALMKKGLDQYDEFVKPPVSTKPGAAIEGYNLAVEEGYDKTFFEYQKELAKAGVERDLTSTLPMNPTLAKQYMVEYPDGTQVPITRVATSLNDIMTGQGLPEGAIGYALAPTAQQLARIQKFSGAKDVLVSSKEQLFGENGIMIDPNYETDIGGQLDQLGKHWTQSDPRYNAYTSTSVGTISTIVKSLGEAGALAEGDVARALNLIPKLAVIDPIAGIYQKGDTPAVARMKYDFLEGLLMKWTTGASKGIGSREMIKEAAADLDEIERKQALWYTKGGGVGGIEPLDHDQNGDSGVYGVDYITILENGKYVRMDLK